MLVGFIVLSFFSETYVLLFSVCFLFKIMQ